MTYGSVNHFSPVRGGDFLVQRHAIIIRWKSWGKQINQLAFFRRAALISPGHLNKFQLMRALICSFESF